MMSKSQKLWNIWFIAYLIAINTYLTVVSIKDYLDFKYQMFDIAYSGNWDTRCVYLVLGLLNVSLALLPIIIYTSVVPQGNLANDGYILGKDIDVLHLTVNEQGKGKIVPTTNKKPSCCKSPTIRLLYMELPPISYLLQIISAVCFLLPKSLMEAHRIKHGVLKANHIWHSDLDFFFDPDQQHSDFLNHPSERYLQPMSVAYFNVGISLILLSLKYSRVMWYISRMFTSLLSFVMLLWTAHVLLEFCSISTMVKVSVNPLVVSDQISIPTSAFTILILSILGNVLSLLSFMTVFHYGVLQYADCLVHKSRKSRRQTLNSSPQMIGSNHLDIPGAFSPSVSENNYSDSTMELIFSKGHVPHILAIVCLCVSASLKSANVYLSFVHFYQTTSDTLSLVNMLASCLFVVVWLIMWFAFALRRTWNFKIDPNTKSISEPLFLNGSSVPNHSGPMQLHQMQNSLLRDPKSSDNNLSKQDMMTLTRNIGLDGCSDDTDMSSKMSSNNYVFLQSMRNGQLGMLDSNGQPPMLRNPLYMSYALNNQGVTNCNTIYANEDLTNNRSMQLEDQMSSEHSYNSSRSRNIGFDNMPPVLPNFDENRYKNPNSVAMEKLIPRYLRNQSLDYNSLLHFSVSNNEYMLPTVTTPTMSYTYDNGIQNYNNNMVRLKQSGGNYLARSTDKYSSLQANPKPATEPLEFLGEAHDEELQRRPPYSGEGVAKMGYDGRRVAMSPVMCPTLEESVSDHLPPESEHLLPRYNGELGDNCVLVSTELHKQPSESNNNDTITVADRMCSQV